MIRRFFVFVGAGGGVDGKVARRPVAPQSFVAGVQRNGPRVGINGLLELLE